MKIDSSTTDWFIAQETQFIVIWLPDGLAAVKIYKPQNSDFTPLPAYNHLVLCCGDFNCQNIEWGYRITSANRELLADWASNLDLTLLYN